MLFIEATSCKTTVITAITGIIQSYQSLQGFLEAVSPQKMWYFSKF